MNALDNEITDWINHGREKTLLHLTTIYGPITDREIDIVTTASIHLIAVTHAWKTQGATPKPHPLDNRLNQRNHYN